jgi:hypothetical protein
VAGVAQEDRHVVSKKQKRGDDFKRRDRQDLQRPENGESEKDNQRSGQNPECAPNVKRTQRNTAARLIFFNKTRCDEKTGERKEQGDAVSAEQRVSTPFR